MDASIYKESYVPTYFILVFVDGGGGRAGRCAKVYLIFKFRILRFYWHLLTDVIVLII